MPYYRTFSPARTRTGRPLRGWPVATSFRPTGGSRRSAYGLHPAHARPVGTLTRVTAPDAPELCFPNPPLADGVVLLRPWTVDDVPAKVAAFADPAVRRFSLPHTAEVTAADVRTSLTGQELARLRGEEVNFAFAEPAEPAVVLGGGSLYGIDREQGRAGVGYWLTPASRGRGVATRATRLMAGWAFAELGVARLELTCGPDNEASQRVAMRCGFVREGVLRSHTLFKCRRRDTVMFSLLPGELR
jgi:RimJ/RimL family protein N-acetyltransferase